MLESVRPTRELDDIAEEISKTELPKGAGVFVSRRLLVSHLLIVLITLISVALTVHYLGIKCYNSDHSLPRIPDESTDSIPQPTVKPMVTDVRLPRDLRPIHYDIRLLPWMEEGNFTISGFIQILFECAANTNKIVLHCADIEIDRMSIRVMEFMFNHLSFYA